VIDTVDHVVLGAGAVGMAVAVALARRGESVRVVNRFGLREPMAGVLSVTGDRHRSSVRGVVDARVVGTWAPPTKRAPTSP
jgi:2-polyprenyl-6-methoxyphenol hydroxylase-like FAD-dependent oxidoreductase